MSGRVSEPKERDGRGQSDKVSESAWDLWWGIQLGTLDCVVRLSVSVRHY